MSGQSASGQCGLYRPGFEHDNCGIGAIVNIKASGCREGAWAELTVEVTSMGPGSKRNARKITQIQKESSLSLRLLLFCSAAP